MSLIETARQIEAALLQLKEWGANGMEPDYTKWVTFHDEVQRVSGEALSLFPSFMEELERREGKPDHLAVGESPGDGE